MHLLITERLTTETLTSMPSPNSLRAPSSHAADLNSLAAQEEATKHLMAARMRVRKGEREEAYNEIKRAFAAHPGDRAAIELLGDLYLEDGETEKALSLYERALKAHPGWVPFEEKLAICRLDLAEMEADRVAKNSGDPLALLQSQMENDAIYERVPHKAVSLSLFLPGAGQFYNDEIEKGAAFLGAGFLSFIGWFYPLWTEASKLPTSQRFDFGTAIGHLSGFWSVVFWLMLLTWLAVYVGSMIDAGRVAAFFNENRRRALGLAK